MLHATRNTKRQSHPQAPDIVVPSSIRAIEVAYKKSCALFS